MNTGVLNQASALPTILQRIAAGDAMAVAECIDVYGKQVWSLAGKYEKNTHDREDAVQEIFITIWQSAGTFDPLKSPEYAFINLLVRRRIISRLRKTYRRPQVSSSETFINARASNFHTELEHRIETSYLVDILNNLTPIEKLILQMFIYDGMSHSEIAKSLKLPIGTVKTKIRRKISKIRQEAFEAENRVGTGSSFSTV